MNNQPIVPSNIIPSPNYPLTNWLASFSSPYINQEEVLPNNHGDIFQEDCVNSGLTAIKEAFLNNYMNSHDDEVSAFIKKNFLNAQGFVKLSVRYSAVMAGLTQTGVNVQVAMNADEIYGLVPYSLWPTPTTPYTFEEYVAPIPVDIIAFGKNTTSLFKMVWTCLWSGLWTPANMALIQESLLTSPIGFASAIGTVNVSGIEQWNGNQDYEHFRVIVSALNNNYQVLDNYPLNGTMPNPSNSAMLRTLAANFPIACAIVGKLLII